MRRTAVAHDDSNTDPTRVLDRIVSIWAVTGVALLFGSAVLRLGMRGAETMRAGLEPLEWLILLLITAAFVYGEGVRALQARYIPHVFRRIDRLRDERSLVYAVLAPLYAMSLIGPPRAGVVRAWAGLLAIALAVLLISRTPYPWRGIIDFAVAAALTWATAVLLYHAPRMLHRQ